MPFTAGKYAPASGRETKYALTDLLRHAAHDLLIECAGQDIADDQIAVTDFEWEVQSLSNNEFVLRAKELTEDRTRANKPAHMFVVTITGGG